ncbi:MAG: CRISPR-associated protein Cas4, partial [Candidatus Methylomirabilis sp.]|nr:CRISPR-associated protein Cas4 [Deltaproteobacteria bacterium]
MQFGPDIVVTAPDSTEIDLVAEVKPSDNGLEAAERQLKRYMMGMNVHVGLLVVPKHVRVFQNRYVARRGESVAEVGEFDVPLGLAFRPSGSKERDEYAFESIVQSWLEGLASASGLDELAGEGRRLAEDY